MTEYGRRIVVELGFKAAVGELHRALRLEGLEGLTRALCTRLDVGTILPTTFAIYELADGETAIVSREPLIPFAADMTQRQRAPVLAGVADHEAQRVARVFATLSHASTPPRRPNTRTPRKPNDRAAVG